MPKLRLVVGLGNPGGIYRRTRHNVGLRLVERLSGLETTWKKFKALGCYARWNGIWLAKSHTFMNQSGDFVAPFCRYYGLKPAEVLVCFDDLSLAFGTLRIRGKGSSGGQKGMESILSAFQTEGVPRLRLGIGPKPDGQDAVTYVLGAFSLQEEKALPYFLHNAARAVETALNHGIEAAMTRFNRTASSPKA